VWVWGIVLEEREKIEEEEDRAHLSLPPRGTVREVD